jgi:1-acyl-sn-glycerol-3-phosphate acyltransferase
MWLRNFWKKFWAFLIFRFLRLFYKIKWEGRENLETLKKHLQDGSAIIVFNHISLDDTLILLIILYFELGRQIKRIFIPASLRHWKELGLGTLMRLSLLFGLEPFPILQNYERGSVLPKGTFGRDRLFLDTALSILANPGAIILFAPEGTRARGKLLVFQKGIGILIKLVAKEGFNTWILPVGIEVEGGANRKINPGKKFIVRLGKLFFAEQILAQINESSKPQNNIAITIREKVAELLSPEYTRAT